MARAFFKGLGRFLAGGTAAAAGSVAKSAGAFVERQSRIAEIQEQNKPALLQAEIAGAEQRSLDRARLVQEQLTLADVKLKEMEAATKEGRDKAEIARLDAESTDALARAESYRLTDARERLRIELQRTEGERSDATIRYLKEQEIKATEKLAFLTNRMEAARARERMKGELATEAAKVAGMAVVGGLTEESAESAAAAVTRVGAPQLPAGESIGDVETENILSGVTEEEKMQIGLLPAGTVIEINGKTITITPDIKAKMPKAPPPASVQNVPGVGLDPFAARMSQITQPDSMTSAPPGPTKPERPPIEKKSDALIELQGNINSIIANPRAAAEGIIVAAEARGMEPQAYMKLYVPQAVWAELMPYLRGGKKAPR